MKTKMPLISVLLAGMLSASAFADNETPMPNESVSNQKEQATIIDPNKSLKYSMDYADKQNDLDLLQIDLKKLQVLQQIELIEKEKNKDKSQTLLATEQAKWEKEKAELIESHKAELKAKEQLIGKIKTQKTKEKEKAKKLSINERVYVTRVSGVGQNLSARIYVDNNVRSVKQGDFVMDGVTVKQINLHSVLFDINGDEKLVPITTADKAYFKTLESQRSNDQMNTDPMDMRGLPPGIEF